MRGGRRLSLLMLGAAIAAAPAALRAQAIPIDLEVGYRWVQVTGNEQMYRTQINDRSGILVRQLHYLSAGPLNEVVDNVRIDAADLGAGPAGILRFSAGKSGIYQLDFTWRETDLYSALPAFANPFIAEGIVPGQHTYSRTRNIYDVSLQILPGRLLTPILGYTRNVYGGPGTTTYFLGGDEFLLDEQYESTDSEYRIGLQLNTTDWQAGVIQGWRFFDSQDTVTLAPGAGNGNNSGPVLGEDLFADAIDRFTTNETNTPSTSAWVTGTLFSRVRLIGSYVRADASAETQSVEADAGSFVSFQIARFFSGLMDDISSRAQTDYWRGSARAEFEIVPHVTLTGGWMARSRELSGTALVSSLFLNTVTFAGQGVGDLLQQIDAVTAIDREDQVFDASVSATMLGPVSVNGGWSQTLTDVTVVADPSEIVVPGGQDGDYERTVNTYGGGLTFAMAGFTLGFDYRKDDANQPILRTDYIDRDRLKARLGWTFRGIVQLGATYQRMTAENDVPEIAYDAKVEELAGDLQITLLKDALTLRASGGLFETDRSILIRIPQNFDIVPTFQKEKGNTWGGGLTLALAPVLLEADYLWFQNDGSIPFTLDRVRVRAEVPVTTHLGVASEWWRDAYEERPAFDQAGPLADYTANRYYVGLRWRP